MAGMKAKKWLRVTEEVRMGGYNTTKHYAIHIHTDDKELNDRIMNILNEYYEVNKNEMEETEEEA